MNSQGKTRGMVSIFERPAESRRPGSARPLEGDIIVRYYTAIATLADGLRRQRACPGRGRTDKPGRRQEVRVDRTCMLCL